MRPGNSVSSVARRHGIAPNMLVVWKRQMSEGGTVAVAAGEDIVGSSRVRELDALRSVQGGRRAASGAADIGDQEVGNLVELPGRQPHGAELGSP